MAVTGGIMTSHIAKMVIKIQRFLGHMAVRRIQETEANRQEAKISKGPQVFINFRVKELRNSFIAHFEAALKEANINYFTGNHEQVGTKLQNLLVRIEQSRVALVIFSKEYTTSVRCLDELVKIYESIEQGTLIGIPIFYKLETSVVRNLEGYFGDNFRTLKRNNQQDLIRTDKWEEALTSMPKIVGMKLSETSEKSDREFIESIVDKVKSLLDDIEMEDKRQGVNSQFYAGKMKITHSEIPENWTSSLIKEPPNQNDWTSLIFAKFNVVGTFRRYCNSGTPSGGLNSGPRDTVENIVTPAFFDAIIRKVRRDCEASGFYTRQAFITAAKSFDAYKGTVSKREIAAMLAQFSHESGSFCYKEEIFKGEYCSPSTLYPCQPGKRYYGRGPLQITWNYNYGEAGNYLGLPLLTDPDMVARNSVVAFKSAMWFWNEHVRAVLDQGFEATTMKITGNTEIGKSTNRISCYMEFCEILGITPGINLS